MEKQLSSFAKLQEADRMMFIAKLCHNMWYNEKCYNDVIQLFTKWNNVKVPEAEYFIDDPNKENV